jgi:hypothetical protein
MDTIQAYVNAYKAHALERIEELLFPSSVSVFFRGSGSDWDWVVCDWLLEKEGWIACDAVWLVCIKPGITSITYSYLPNEFIFGLLCAELSDRSKTWDGKKDCWILDNPEKVY